ncbi:Coatomer beta subunit [Trema orientale]|uniref:Coatomer beta subunit n=1 Tax=Trema orientale TaxID=63057 RepID=A0A2P5EGG0_TREOI|nr:Coatomer beta subunit [Trema orientale]
MEGIELEEGLTRPFDDTVHDDGDFCNSILTRFSDSTREEHQHLCAVIGAMSQELKDQNMPSSPVAYFGATWSSLDRLLSEPVPPSHVIESLLTILSLLLPRIPVPVLKKKGEVISGPVVRVLQSASLTVGSATSGLKCLSHFLIIKEASNWSEVSQLYGFLLNFATDSRPKVRRQAQLCLRYVIENFQGKSLGAHASEGLTDIFKRFLLFSAKPDANSTEGLEAAQKFLYVLDALKDCLPLMSTKHTTVILEHFKALLKLHQPLVTRRITDCLLLLCLNPDSVISSETLVDILCSLALSVTTNETSVDAMTFTARLLDVGIVKVYSLNRQLCVIKLPVVFNALRDILASEHEEAIHSAVNTLKSLIHNCIDESLIKEGVDEIKLMNLSMDSRKSGPTIIEKVCATIESLLGYHYTAVWDLSFQVISSMFDKLGADSSYLMRGILKGLADMEKLPDEDFPFRKQLHECLGSALGAMGPQTFLGLLPFNLDAEDLSEVNVWLFPILKQYTIGAHLGFFMEILDMIRQMKKKSEKLEVQGRVYSSRSVDALVYSLWSLLPSFCNYPFDTAKSFKDVEKDLCSALNEEGDVRGIVCSSLQILIQQNKKILENDASDLTDYEAGIARRVLSYYTPHVAADNLSALKESGRELLPVLSTVFLKSMKDDGGSLQSAIGGFASISDKGVVSRLFKNTMQKLLKVTQSAGKAEYSKKSNSMAIDGPSDESSPLAMRARLLDLAVSLLPGLNTEEIKLLFTAIKPALQDGEGLIQKKAYKVLSLILKSCDVFLSSKLDELLQLMIEVLPSCHFSAKRHRLDCLYFLIVYVSKVNIEQRRHDIISSFLTEIILALKEANKKTRNRAYDILVEIGHACGDEEKGGKRENLYQFFNMVAGGLAGETPHMISAAVKGLARLVYEFSDLVSTACNLLPSTFLLLQRKNREIAKANLGLLKVLVAKSKAEGLQLHLKSMVEGLLMWQDDTKTHFKAKVKLLLEMLVKKCGLDPVKAVMPEEHMKLLTNIRKIKERKERKLAAPSEEARSHVSRATTSRLSRWNDTKIFSDFGDDETENSDLEYMDDLTVSGRRGKASSLFKSKASSVRSRTRGNKNLPEHLFGQIEDDEPLDLLDRQRTRSALRSMENLKRKDVSDCEPEFDSDGRLVIREDGKLKMEKSFDPESDIRSEAGSHRSMTSKKTQKRQKTSDSGWAYTGSEYANKKAGGDVQKKDKLEPYAYWPLDRKMMSRRPEHRAAAKKGMASVVKMTKKLEGKSASSLLSAGGLKFKKSHKKSGKRKSK